MLIDTHFHLDLMDNMHRWIRDFYDSGTGVIAVGTTPKAFEREIQFCSRVPNIRVSLGFHPQLVAERVNEIELFLRLLKSSKYIGEIGLDFNSSYIANREQQLSCFRRIAKACADEGNKVLSIHSVKASGTVIDELEKAGTFNNNTCIFHWFTGNAVERKRAIELGALFSINPRMLKTKSGQENIRAIPADRLLLETDAPFAIRVESAQMLKEKLLELKTDIMDLRGIDEAKIIEENSLRIFEAL